MVFGSMVWRLRQIDELGNFQIKKIKFKMKIKKG